MKGFTASIINAITDNLRDRYDTGFPILKELIQNADDAEARRVVFGRHEGFPRAAHPLLQGPALWVWNDGILKDGDLEAIASFGINSKAGDDRTIGKFGLGMKSVFHLCEAFFYLAWDQELHREGLSPWAPEVHPEWAEISDADWTLLEEVAREEWGRYPASGEGHWFLLWIPLRRDSHLETARGRTGSIIQRFPGDPPHADLQFLDYPRLRWQLADILPLLRHLEHIELRPSATAAPGFSLALDASKRLERQARDGQASGAVTLTPDGERLTFAGLQHESADAAFRQLKGRREWPRTYYRDAQGHERPAADKSRPEAAVLWAQSRDASRLTVRWAVFLPLAAGEEAIRIVGGDRHYRITLHGQFFVDAGRKGIHDLEGLHEVPASPEASGLDDAALRSTWNRCLAQQVLAPLVLPTLAHFVETEGLNDRECGQLTEALGGTDLFRRFRAPLCAPGAWCRVMVLNAGPTWRLVGAEKKDRLRPLPAPPQSDPGRPWQVLPLLTVGRWLPFDRAAPRLLERDPQWGEAELEQLLGRAEGLFTDGPRMDYLADFLDSCAGPYRTTDRIQTRLLGLFWDGLRTAPAAAWRQVNEKSRRLLGFLEPKRRLSLAAELPEGVLGRLWQVDAPVLLVPKGLEPSAAGDAVPGHAVLARWLEVLDTELDASADGARNALLDAARGLLARLNGEARGRFLRVHSRLRVIGVRDVRHRRDQAVSFADIEEIRAAGTLYGFAQGPREDDRLGLAPRLAEVLPEGRVWLVRADIYREVFTDSRDLPRADDGRACLAAVGRTSTGVLGTLQARGLLLERANDPGPENDARRGLRYLLHGDADHLQDDETTLWIPRHGQHGAWAKLWGQMHGEEGWCRVPVELADALPRARWNQARIEEIDGGALIAELQSRGKGVPQPAAFSRDERDEILAHIDDHDLWRRLTLHTTCDGTVVSAEGDQVYLAPEGGAPDEFPANVATLIAPSPDPRVAEPQRQWLRPLDQRARMEIALACPEPAAHWRTIMDALAEAGGADLPERMRSTAWLPTRYGTPVKPEDVIDLPEALRDEAQRLVAEHRATHGPCFAVVEELDAALRRHEAFGVLERACLSREAAGLDRLALLLEDLPRYHVGPWPNEPAPDQVSLLADCDGLPGWRLIQTAAQEQFGLPTAWASLRSGICRRLAEPRVRENLRWIAANTDRWEVRKAAFDNYLDQLVSSADFARGQLAALRLASGSRQWRPPAELCVGAHGVDPDWLLDEKQAEILDGRIHRADRRPEVAGECASGNTTAELDLTLRATPQILADYFRPWGGAGVPMPMIGLVLGLLGRAVRDLAEQYLSPHSFEWLSQQLPWTDPGRDRSGRLEWMGEKTLMQALDVIEARVRVVTDGQISVPNLLGDQIRVPMAPLVHAATVSQGASTTLLAGSPSWWGGGYGVDIALRHVDLTRVTPDQASRLLRGTAEHLFARLYNQRRPDLSGLWRELDRTDQLEIGAARRMVLDNIPLYLRQLRVESLGLQHALDDYDKARRRVAEAETRPEKGGVDALWAKQTQSLEALARRLNGDLQDQAAVLAGVKRKLEDFKYTAASIPFELFQNADDAAVELGQIDAFPAVEFEVPDFARTFVVETGDDQVRFLHWGRPINARGPVGFDGDGRGFGRDLEKMLILSASDKLERQGVTGRFGLGFKSVLLACDRPRILSGRLAVEIVAGILPQPWEHGQAVRDALSRHAKDPRRPGTLIELPGNSDDQRGQILTRFRELAGMLCVFARALRRVVLDQWEGASPGRLEYRWSPTEVCPGLEHGRLRLTGSWGAETDALCIRGEEGAILMALEPQGFRPLGDTIPTVWVTAPTREQQSVGFALNGPFGLDAGRARLDANSARNQELARRIGHSAGDAMGRLFERTRREWPEVRHALGLVADLSPHDFWLGIWKGLTEGWLNRRRDAAADLAREAALALLERFAEVPGTVPNGLAVPYQALVSAREVRYELDKGLADGETLGLLGRWERFTQRYPASALVAPEIGAILKHGDMADLGTVGLEAVVGVLDPPRVQPGDARVLGMIWAFTEENPKWNSPDTKKRLDKLFFRTQAGGWCDVGRLLANDGNVIKQEEAWRHNVMAPEWRLSPEYYDEEGTQGHAVKFFLLCRGPMKIQVRDLTPAVLAPKDRPAQVAALQLLARSDVGGEVSKEVRGEDWLALALTNEPLLAEAGLNDSERKELRRRLATDKQIDEAIRPGTEPESSPSDVYSLDIRTALERIHQWWAREGAAQVQDYDKRLYPGMAMDLRTSTDAGSFDRSSWLVLLALGAFQAIGRTQEEQHRGFIEHCDQKGWWDIFAASAPQTRPDRWMEIIEDYAEGQHDDEQWSQWMGQFPRLYRLSRWLDDYVGLCRSIDRYAEPFSLDDIRASRATPIHGGGGYDAPALTRTLKVGAHLVVRELLRHGVISNPLAIPHAYAPIERTCNLFQRLGAWVETSGDIHRLLVEHLGEDRATFGRAYDIPLRVVASDDDLQQRLFGTG